MHITIVAGTRPNFVKISPIINEIKRNQVEKSDITYRLIHTGQHYDETMSGSFFQELNIPLPHSNLAVGSGTQAEQTAAIMISFENELLKHPTDLVLVVGDVTSTMACAIVAKKLNVKLAHVEGGIRSFDDTMPEEINRKVTDSITDYFFTTSKFANENLAKEGVSKDKIYFVGNVMIDTLLANYNNFKKPSFFEKFKLVNKNYLVLTLHRPNNVDNSEKLIEILSEISKTVKECPVIFPVHPRTANKLITYDQNFGNVLTVAPMSYLEFNYIVKNAKGVLTDSGGITEETTIMNIPCLTLRDNTERPETTLIGTNELIGTDPKNIRPNLEKLLSGDWKKGSIPELWDGKSAERIIQKLLKIFQKP